VVLSGTALDCGRDPVGLLQKSRLQDAQDKTADQRRISRERPGHSNFCGDDSTRDGGGNKSNESHSRRKETTWRYDDLQTNTCRNKLLVYSDIADPLHWVSGELTGPVPAPPTTDSGDSVPGLEADSLRPWSPTAGQA